MKQRIEKLEPLIHVIGLGEVKSIPDGVDIKVRVENEGDEPSVVKATNDKTIQEVIVFLKSQGVDPKDVQTEYVQLNKNFDHHKKTYKYVANQMLTVKLKDLTNYENVMTGLLHSGINRIDGVKFTTSAINKLKADARVNAIMQSKEKAAAYANAIGQSIGKAVQITEEGFDNSRPPVYKARMMSSGMDSNSGGETIAPGELTVRAKVSVSYELI